MLRDRVLAMTGRYIDTIRIEDGRLKLPDRLCVYQRGGRDAVSPCREKLEDL